MPDRNGMTDHPTQSEQTRSLRTTRVGQTLAPAVPSGLEDTGIDPEILANLALRFAYTVPVFTTQAAADRLALPLSLVTALLEALRSDRLLEAVGESGLLGYRFVITPYGRERARRLLEISGYVGPTPVSLEAYVESLEWQFEHLPIISPEQVAESLEDLVLSEAVVEIVGLAASSGRSLFLYGPPGNGKTSIGHLLHTAIQGHVWIPYCIGIENEIIRIFDPQCHEPAPPTNLTSEEARMIDRRWVRVKRPFVVVGGELTLDALELAYAPGLRYYEAPLHLKANGGTFLLDDFGYQQVEPRKLLSRWVFPLEHQVDHLTLRTGQKLEVPFRQMLIVSTNMNPSKVMDPAFLRRIGYRLYVGNPTPEQYAQIFTGYAARYDCDVPAGLIDHIIGRYNAENRALNSCEPRDLIERARDIARHRGESLQLTEDRIDLAWKSYFGDPLRHGELPV